MVIDKDIQKLGISISREKIRYFVFFSCLGLLTYLGYIVWELPNPDAIWNGIYYKHSWMWECKLGRYMIYFFQRIFEGVISPATFSFMSIIVLAVISMVVISVFELSGIAAYICGAMIVVSPHVVSLLSYYYCSFYYMIAYLLAVLAAYIMCRKTGLWSALFACGMLCISMATYQAYIGVTLCLCVMFVLLMMLKDNNKVKAPEAFLRIVYMGVIFIGGVIFYLVSSKLILFVMGMTFESSRGFSQMGHIQWNNIFVILRDCYKYCWEYFFSDEMINNLWFIRKEMNCLVFLCGIIMFLHTCFRLKGEWWHKVISLVLASVFPVMLMSITIAGSKVSIYDTTGVLMLPTMNYAYVLILCILTCKERTAEKKIVRCMERLSCIGLLAVIFLMFNLCLSAQIYQKHNMNKTRSLMFIINDRIEDVVEESGKYKVCIVGNMENGNYPEVYPELAESLNWLTASYGTVWNTYTGTQECWSMFFLQYQGKKFQTCTQEEYDEIFEEGFINSMKNFPDENSVSVYDDSVIVIKLSSPMW